MLKQDSSSLVVTLSLESAKHSMNILGAICNINIRIAMMQPGAVVEFTGKKLFKQSRTILKGR